MGPGSGLEARRDAGREAIRARRREARRVANREAGRVVDEVDEAWHRRRPVER